jgi:hypothetical protein
VTGCTYLEEQLLLSVVNTLVPKHQIFGNLISVTQFLIFNNFQVERKWTLIFDKVKEISARDKHCMFSHNKIVIIHGGQDDIGPRRNATCYNIGSPLP